MAIPFLPLLGLAVQAAPQVARWLGGEQAAQVTAEVADAARTAFGTDDAEAIREAAARDPAAWLQFQARLAELGAARERAEREAELAALAHRIEALRVQAASAEQARQALLAGAQASPGFIWVAPALSVLILGLFAATFYALSVEELRNKDILNILVGGLTASVAAVIQYWFGSSAGSRAKDETVRSLAARPGG